jgi:hypothetical protein
VREDEFRLERILISSWIVRRFWVNMLSHAADWVARTWFPKCRFEAQLSLRERWSFAIASKDERFPARAKRSTPRRLYRTGRCVHSGKCECQLRCTPSYSDWMRLHTAWVHNPPINPIIMCAASSSTPAFHQISVISGCRTG